MTLRIAFAAMVLAFGTLGAAAQDATPTPAPVGALTFQLNKAETRDGNCQLTFVVQNETGTVIDKSVYNIAIIDTDGAVSQLVNIEFRPLPVGRLKAQSFGITGITCENISAMSINEFTSCTAAGAESTLCEEAIVETSRAGMSIQFPWTL